MHLLLDVLWSEGKKAAAKEFYFQCKHDGRKTEDGGLGIDEPKVPCGWMRTGNPENASEMKNRLTGVTKVHNPKDIQAYFVDLLYGCFRSCGNFV